jgi:dCTP deaminase
MMLVDYDIKRALHNGEIVIIPFDERCLGTNSYDVHLASTLKIYLPKQEMVRLDRAWAMMDVLDVRASCETRDIKIPEQGFVLMPGELYLASTVEYTETHRCVPMLNGKSSIGRLGLSIHVTAGTGDVGFKGHWTMELFVIKPLRIYAGMKIAQLLYVETRSEPITSYDKKPDAKYNNIDPKPQPSQAWRNFGTSSTEE